MTVQHAPGIASPSEASNHPSPPSLPPNPNKADPAVRQQAVQGTPRPITQKDTDVSLQEANGATSAAMVCYANILTSCRQMCDVLHE